MKYIVTGVDGKLGGRVAELMLSETDAANLIFTCPNLSWLKPEKKKNGRSWVLLSGRQIMIMLPR